MLRSETEINSRLKSVKWKLFQEAHGVQIAVGATVVVMN
jgi:hypothetical protein